MRVPKRKLRAFYREIQKDRLGQIVDAGEWPSDLFGEQVFVEYHKGTDVLEITAVLPDREIRIIKIIPALSEEDFIQRAAESLQYLKELIRTSRPNASVVVIPRSLDVSKDELRKKLNEIEPIFNNFVYSEPDSIIAFSGIFAYLLHNLKQQGRNEDVEELKNLLINHFIDEILVKFSKELNELVRRFS